MCIQCKKYIKYIIYNIEYTYKHIELYIIFVFFVFCRIGTCGIQKSKGQKGTNQKDYIQQCKRLTQVFVSQQLSDSSSC